MCLSFLPVVIAIETYLQSQQARTSKNKTSREIRLEALRIMGPRCVYIYVEILYPLLHWLHCGLSIPYYVWHCDCDCNTFFMHLIPLCIIKSAVEPCYDFQEVRLIIWCNVPMANHEIYENYLHLC